MTNYQIKQEAIAAKAEGDDVVMSAEKLLEMCDRINQLERENEELRHATGVMRIAFETTLTQEAKTRDNVSAMRRELARENAELRKDAERWKFTVWWQDQKRRPPRIQDELTNMHRSAYQRGSLRPNGDELQRATDAAIAAMKVQT